MYEKANWQQPKGNCRWESCSVRPAVRGISHGAWGKLKGALLPRHGQQIRRLNCLSSQDANWKIHQRARSLSMRLIDWQAAPPPPGYMAGLSFPQRLRLRPLPHLTWLGDDCFNASLHSDARECSHSSSWKLEPPAVKLSAVLLLFLLHSWHAHRRLVSKTFLFHCSKFCASAAASAVAGKFRD